MLEIQRNEPNDSDLKMNLFLQPPIFDTASIMESLDQRDGHKKITQSTGMSMNDFHLLSVLGRGHFGKVMSTVAECWK